jgi:hypothetical protein
MFHLVIYPGATRISASCSRSEMRGRTSQVERTDSLLNGVKHGGSCMLACAACPINPATVRKP